MARPRLDRMCLRVDICISNDLNDAVEIYKAKQLIKGVKLLKSESTEQYFEMVHEFYKKNQGK